MTHYIRHLITLWAMILLSYSCQPESTDVKVFKYNQTDHITSLDPAFAKSQNNIWATHHLFEGLVRLDDELRIVPSLAKSYAISADGLTYTFILRDDVTMQYCSVVPQEAVEYYGSTWAQHPVGTGPYQFKRWVENQALYLTKNTSYRNSLGSNVDGIKTTFIPDRKIAFLELMNGNLDFVSGLESSFAPMLLTRDGSLRSEYQQDIKFQKAPYLNTEYLGINVETTASDSPLRHRKFRQALNYGIDRELMPAPYRPYNCTPIKTT